MNVTGMREMVQTWSLRSLMNSTTIALPGICSLAMSVIDIRGLPTRFSGTHPLPVRVASLIVVVTHSAAAAFTDVNTTSYLMHRQRHS
uniref:Secreted protein n=1 Tax=Angiostrongylus cantonensis TaxID=6313 RepID=A0A0K0DLT2_ANGCA